MATFSEALLSCRTAEFSQVPVGSLGLSMVSLPFRDEGQALVRIRPNRHDLLTSSCHFLRRLPGSVSEHRADHGITKYPEVPLPDIGVTFISET